MHWSGHKPKDVFYPTFGLGFDSVTDFKITDYIPTGDVIKEKQLWDNIEYFLRAVIPEAEKHNNINLALHLDDPPLAKLVLLF